MQYRTYRIVAVFFLLGLILRIFSVYPSNTIIGFDQVRDFFTTITIFRDHDLKIIGPTAGNNPYLHHGVLYYYYLIPPLLFFKNNPMAAVYWNILFNAAACIIIFFLGRDLTGKNITGLTASLISASSFQMIQFSGWLSNPTATLLTVPVFFWGLWAYYQHKKWGLPLACLFLGLSVQFELFFLYLIPAALIFWIVFRPRIPNLKVLSISLSLFIISVSTMIATEIKFQFNGIKHIFTAGSLVGGPKDDILLKFWQKYLSTFSSNLLPTFPLLGIFLGLAIITLVIYYSRNSKPAKFIFLYLASPAIMLLLGYHNAPWFLVGLPPAVALAFGYITTRIKKSYIIIPITLLILYSNVAATSANYGRAQTLLEPDASALLSSQLQVVDYTYQSSGGLPFAITSVTNPLYINALWGYDYYWYGKSKYGFLPTWIGGNQLYPYNTLSNADCGEKNIYLIIDQTNRIPQIYKQIAIDTVSKNNRLSEEKTYGGFLVQKYDVSQKCQKN